MKTLEMNVACPRENISPEMACFLNTQDEVRNPVFNPKIGDYIKMEIDSSVDDLGLYNKYINLQIEFLKRCNLNKNHIKK